jgi:proton glutamate symport protein
MQLYNKILIGLLLGVLFGGLANLADIGWLRDSLVFLEPLGTAFIRLITMIVIPLVVASLIVGTASLGDITRLGRIGGKTMVYYMGTTAVAATIGILLSNLVQPGSRIDPATRDQLAAQFAGQASASMEIARQAPSTLDVLLGIIPRNPIQAAANFELLPLIFFSVIFGAAVSVVEEHKRGVVLDFFGGVNEAAMRVIRWIMHLAPYAVFALIASVIAKFGLDLLKSLLIYALTVFAGLLLHMFGTISLVVRFLGKLNPVQFFRRIAAVPVMAFSTSSSNATLPVTIDTAEHKLGISRSVASFVLPLGATINMDGTALYQAVAVMFIAQIYGIPMDIGLQVMIVLTATLASIGAAGVPSAGIITLVIVLQSVGLGSQVEAGIALILGVDRILDMMRTVVNVTGDLSCATFVARTEGEIRDAVAQAPPVPVQG